VAAHPLRFGSMIHTALERRYPVGTQRGPHPAKTFRELFDADIAARMGSGKVEYDPAWDEHRELGITMLRGYVDLYGKDDNWRVLATERKFEQPILDAQGNQVALAIGVIDLIVQERSGNKDVMIVDHKATAGIDTRHLVMDDQAGQYWTFGVDWMYRAGLMDPKKHQLSHMLFNFLNKKTPDDRPRDDQGNYLNKDGTISKNQGGAPLFERHKQYRGGYDREMMRRRTADEARMILMTRAGELPVIKSPGKFTCSMCNVREICELHEVGQDYEAMAKAVLRPKQYREMQEAVDWEQAH
jgi:hypothetical protein